VFDPVLVMKIKPHLRLDREFGGDIRHLVPEAAFDPVPRHAQYDADGYRNMHGAEPVDVIVIGDSFMDAGADDTDTFAARLEKTSGLKVANYGVSSYGPFQYVEVLKRHALRNQARVALFSIFEG